MCASATFVIFKILPWMRLVIRSQPPPPPWKGPLPTELHNNSSKVNDSFLWRGLLLSTPYLSCLESFSLVQLFIELNWIVRFSFSQRTHNSGGAPTPHWSGVFFRDCGRAKAGHWGQHHRHCGRRTCVTVFFINSWTMVNVFFVDAARC